MREQVYSKEGITLSLNSETEPLESIWDVASIPKDLFGEKRCRTFMKKLQKLDCWNEAKRKSQIPKGWVETKKNPLTFRKGWRS